MTQAVQNPDVALFDVTLVEKLACKLARQYGYLHLIEDMKQEALCQVWLKFAAFDPSRSSFCHFAFIIIKTEVVDSMKRLNAPYYLPIRHKTPTYTQVVETATHSEAVDVGQSCVPALTFVADTQPLASQLVDVDKVKEHIKGLLSHRLSQDEVTLAVEICFRDEKVTATKVARGHNVSDKRFREVLRQTRELAKDPTLRQWITA